jgi:hypothetical protein
MADRSNLHICPTFYLLSPDFRLQLRSDNSMLLHGSYR